MNLVVVLPFCKKDTQAALRLLAWIKELGGCPEHDLVLLVAHGVADAAIATLKKESSFRTTDVMRTPFALPDESRHPIGPNWMFETAVKNLSTSFLWLEPDSVPLCSGWLNKLEAEYRIGISRNKSFMGDVSELSDPRYPRKIPSGVSIYPHDAIRHYGSLQLNRRSAWDIQFADRIIPFFHKTKLIQNFVNHNDPPTFSGNGHSGMKISDLRKEAVLFHPSKDGSLIQILNGERLRRSRRRFYHSGDLGDIIYSLPTVKELGGGDMLIGPDLRVNMPVREKMNPDRAALIIPLLEAQSYIRSSVYSDEMVEPISYDLNQMRQLLRSSPLIDCQSGYNLARCYLKWFHLDLGHDRFKWLDVIPAPKEKVIINRSERYRHPGFRWDLILKKYRSSIGFIGLKYEHEDFEKQWGKVSFIETSNLLSAAQIIAGADLFVGNQSCCYAIAEGLKKTSVLEVCPDGCNTLFDRDLLKNKSFIGCTPETRLPEIGDTLTIKKSTTKSFIVSGHVNLYTGLGRDLCKLVDYSVKNGYSVSIEPITVDERLPLSESVRSALKTKSKADDPRFLICPLTDLRKNILRGDVVMTMWESTRLPPGSVQILNEHASLLVTPSSWCATVFSANGVMCPIEIVPLGCDLDFFKPHVRNKRNSHYTFGAAGRLGHGGKRKGIEDTIEAFKMAFPKGTEKVRLSLKLFEDCYVPDSVKSDKRISFIAKSISDDEVLKWYRSIDCLVCLSKAEGWGNHVHEAMAMNIPVIAPCYSGLADLVPLIGSLPFKVVDASEGYMGHWCQPDLKHSSLFMRVASSDGIKPHTIAYSIGEYSESIIKLITE